MVSEKYKQLKKNARKYIQELIQNWNINREDILEAVKRDCPDLRKDTILKVFEEEEYDYYTS